MFSEKSTYIIMSNGQVLLVAKNRLSPRENITKQAKHQDINTMSELRISGL